VPTCRLWNLFAQVHECATGRELLAEDAMNDFGAPKRLTSVVEHNGVLDDPARPRKLEALVSERRNGF
jgi:hypothetical protein